jgi:hypothetical protein
MMSKTFIRNENSEKGKAFWMSVDSTAETAPEWVKERIMNATITKEHDQSEKPVKFTIKIIC